MRVPAESGYEGLVSRAAPSLLQIRSRAGTGAATVWEPGLAVTNRHVVAGERAWSEAGVLEVVQADAHLDLCLLATPDADRPPLERRSDPPRVGELVLAIGHPWGLRSAVTAGIVAGEVSRGSRRFIRADLRLAPGNSGGPLVDSRGRLVGLNVMVAGGMGLAIPVPEVEAFVLEALAGTGTPDRDAAG